MATKTTTTTVTKKGINNNSKGVSRCVSMLSVLTWPLSGRSGVDLLCALLTAQHTHVNAKQTLEYSGVVSNFGKGTCVKIFKGFNG